MRTRRLRKPRTYSRFARAVAYITRIYIIKELSSPVNTVGINLLCLYRTRLLRASFGKSDLSFHLCAGHRITADSELFKNVASVRPTQLKIRFPSLSPTYFLNRKFLDYGNRFICFGCRNVINLNKTSFSSGEPRRLKNASGTRAARIVKSENISPVFLTSAARSVLNTLNPYPNGPCRRYKNFIYNRNIGRGGRKARLLSATRASARGASKPTRRSVRRVLRQIRSLRRSPITNHYKRKNENVFVRRVVFSDKSFKRRSATTADSLNAVYRGFQRIKNGRCRPFSSDQNPCCTGKDPPAFSQRR